MLNAENTRLCWDLLAKFGVNNQYYKIMEEAAELIEAASHMAQGDGDKDNFLEEMVDVIVVSQQFFNDNRITDDEINKIARAKILRALGGNYAHTSKER